MRYLITQPNKEPFFTDYFTAENCFQEGMTVFDLMNGHYTRNGYDWMEITFDHL